MALKAHSGAGAFGTTAGVPVKLAVLIVNGNASTARVTPVTVTV